MKKKILSSVIITVIFAVAIMTSFFLALSNLNELNRTRTELKNFSDYIIEVKDITLEEINKYRIGSSHVRVTVLDEDGTVEFDNENEQLSNHSDRSEVIEAKEKGEAYATRISETSEEKLVYYARKLDDGRILRISVPLATSNVVNNENYEACIIIIGIVMVFSVALSLKLVRAIVDPINDLEKATYQISNGDLHRRVKITSNDEIGKLGVTFNNMAEQLQSKINEVIDRQSRLESILKSMQSGVIAVNLNDEVMTINPYAKRVFGIRRDITGEAISKYITEFDITSFLNEEDDVEEEIKLSKPMKREIRIKKASIINGLERIGKVIAVQDITDIKKLENMRSQFVANVSHELKTPLTSIKGFSETLKYVEDAETRERFLGIINNEADRLTRLINDVLVLSKMESDTQGTEDEFSPNNVIEDVISMLKRVADSKNIKLIVEQNNNNLIYGDRDRFLQLVLNLVENGVKYSNEGAFVKVKSYCENEKYVLEVEDNGIGIPDEDLPHIFERFYRVDKARKSGGTGLGLAIVKYIVKSFNGDINVESKLGQGTKFTIKIDYIDVN